MLREDGYFRKSGSKEGGGPRVDTESSLWRKGERNFLKGATTKKSSTSKVQREGGGGL